MQESRLRINAAAAVSIPTILDKMSIQRLMARGHFCHPISTLLPPNDRMHARQLFSSTYCRRLIPVDLGVERSSTVADAEIRIDVFPPTGAGLPAGVTAGYDSDGRARHVVGGRKKTHGSANQIHATIWRTRLRAKAV